MDNGENNIFKDNKTNNQQIDPLSSLDNFAKNLKSSNLKDVSDDVDGQLSDENTTKKSKSEVNLNVLWNNGNEHANNGLFGTGTVFKKGQNGKIDLKDSLGVPEDNDKDVSQLVAHNQKIDNKETLLQENYTNYVKHTQENMQTAREKSYDSTYSNFTDTYNKEQEEFHKKENLMKEQQQELSGE